MSQEQRSSLSDAVGASYQPRVYKANVSISSATLLNSDGLPLGQTRAAKDHDPVQHKGQKYCCSDCLEKGHVAQLDRVAEYPQTVSFAGTSKKFIFPARYRLHKGHEHKCDLQHNYSVFRDMARAHGQMVGRPDDAVFRYSNRIDCGEEPVARRRAASAHLEDTMREFQAEFSARTGGDGKPSQPRRKMSKGIRTTAEAAQLIESAGTVDMAVLEDQVWADGQNAYLMKDILFDNAYELYQTLAQKGMKTETSGRMPVFFLFSAIAHGGVWAKYGGPKSIPGQATQVKHGFETLYPSVMLDFKDDTLRKSVVEMIRRESPNKAAPILVYGYVDPLQMQEIENQAQNRGKPVQTASKNTGALASLFADDELENYGRPSADGAGKSVYMPLEILSADQVAVWDGPKRFFELSARAAQKSMPMMEMDDLFGSMGPAAE